MLPESVEKPLVAIFRIKPYMDPTLCSPQKFMKCIAYLCIDSPTIFG